MLVRPIIEDIKSLKIERITESKAPTGGDHPNPEHVTALTTAVSSWFVRKDSKFYEIESLTTKLSKDDVQRICLHRFAEEFTELDFDNRTLGEVFRRAIDQKHAAPGQSIPVWNGGWVCKPGAEGRRVWKRGAVRVNTWSRPSYRDTPAQPSMGVAGEFFDAVFTRDAEKELELLSAP